MYRDDSDTGKTGSITITDSGQAEGGAIKSSLMFAVGKTWNAIDFTFYLENDNGDRCVIPFWAGKQEVPFLSGEVSKLHCEKLRDFLDKHLKETDNDVAKEKEGAA